MSLSISPWIEIDEKAPSIPCKYIMEYFTYVNNDSDGSIDKERYLLHKEFEKNKQKDFHMGLSKFITELYLSDLIKINVFIDILQNILGINKNYEHEQYPNEENIKEICSIFEITGEKLNLHHKDLLHKLINRLIEFKELKDIYKMKERFAIMDILDLRDNNWKKKNRK
jgi:hypothetical protein